LIGLSRDREFSDRALDLTRGNLKLQRGSRPVDKKPALPEIANLQIRWLLLGRP